MVKKVLFGSILMFSAAALFVGCSDEDVFDSNLNQDVLKYEAAFKKTFNVTTIPANQDWGFGTGSTRSALTRTISPDFPFPDAPSNSEFAQTKDADAVLLTKYLSGNNFYIDSSVSKNGETLQPNGSNIRIYVEGTVEPTGFYTPANTTIYLLPGSKLILPSGASAFGQSNTKIYIPKTAELAFTGTTAQFGYGCTVYNQGTISVKNIEVCNNGVLYNQGTIDITGTIKAVNSNSVIVNDGTMKGSYLGIEGSAHFQNNNEVVISGETSLSSNNNTWVNNEHYTTGSFSYTAGSSDVINNCQLNVTGQFYIDLGDTKKNGFRMDAGASVVTKTFLGEGPFYIHMGGGSLFQVTETATMNATNPGYGFYCDDSSTPSVLAARNIVAGSPGKQFQTTYGGNLYVYASESHFAQGNDGNPSHLFIGLANSFTLSRIYAPGFESGKPNVTINRTNCNPGFEGDDDDDFIPNIRVMGEDLSVGDNTDNYEADFDFNDVVFDVMWTSTGAKIRLMAAGGTLPLTVGGIEIHGKFAEANPGRGITTSTVINATNKTEYATPIFELTGNFKNADGDYDASLIPVYVTKNGRNVEITAIRGKVASKIGVDPRVSWASEKQFIQNLYPNFGKWVNMEVEVFY